MATSIGEGKLWIQTCLTLLVVEGTDKYINVENRMLSVGKKEQESVNKDVVSQNISKETQRIMIE